MVTPKSPQSPLRSCCTAPLIGYISGILFFLWLYGPGTANIYNISWLLTPKAGNVGTDQAQHFIGWLYFKNAPWSFPLGGIPAYLGAFGSTVAYTDSIPWLAVLAKIMAPADLPPFQYSGLWLLACFALNGLFGGFILRRLTQDPLAIAAGLFFVITTPVLVSRVGHIALCGQWLILAAIAWQLRYWEQVQAAPQAGRLTGWMAAACFVLGPFTCITHPYLGAMVSAILLVALASNGSWRQRLSRVLGLCCGNLLALYLFGYFPSPTERTGGSHYWSADVFTFFNSMGQSALLPGFRVWGGQYEGFAFLGSGAMALTLLIVTRGAYRRQLRSQLAGLFNRPLNIALLLLYVYALSSNIRFFSMWLVSLRFLYAPLEPLTAAFRAAGRFAWPLHYALLLGAVVLIPQVITSAKRARACLGLAIVLQLICQYPTWQAVRHTPSTYQQDDYAELAAVLATKQEVKLIPPFINYMHCTDTEYPLGYWVPIAFAASLANQKLNSGSLANPSDPIVRTHCQQELSALAQGPQAGVAYIFHSAWFEAHAPTQFKREHCTTASGYLICSY